MLLLLSKPQCFALDGHRGAVWQRQASQWVQHERSTGGFGLHELGSQLRRLIDSAPKHAVYQIVLDGPELVHWIQADVPGARSVQEVMSAAQVRCARLFGGTPASWWVSGSWAHQHGSLCAGMPTALARDLEAMAPGRLQFLSLQFALVQALAGGPMANGWAALDLGHTVVLVQFQARTPVMLEPVRLGATAATASDRLERVAERLVQLALRDGDAPAQGDSVWWPLSEVPPDALAVKALPGNWRVDRPASSPLVDLAACLGGLQ